MDALAAAVLRGALRSDDIKDHPQHREHPGLRRAGRPGHHPRPPRERLGRSDVGIILIRKIWERELRALAAGRPLKQWAAPPRADPHRRRRQLTSTCRSLTQRPCARLSTRSLNCTDWARAGYPAELFRDLAALACIDPGCRVLEIGCGTGQATMPLAERGCEIVCVELRRQSGRGGPVKAGRLPVGARAGGPRRGVATPARAVRYGHRCHSVPLDRPRRTGAEGRSSAAPVVAPWPRSLPITLRRRREVLRRSPGLL